MSQPPWGIQRGVPVSEETIQLLVEFKFLEESFMGQACMICKLWICQRFERRKKRCVHYTSVCSMISIGMFMLTASVLLLSGKQMQISVRVYLFSVFD